MKATCTTYRCECDEVERTKAEWDAHRKPGEEALATTGPMTVKEMEAWARR